MDNYSKGKLLGKGSFGSAWLCTSKLDAKNYVIKEVDISRMPRAEREAAEQEAKVGSLPLKRGSTTHSVLPGCACC
jgi:NIMA (never in mitosis gene a)-related kinase